MMDFSSSPLYTTSLLGLGGGAVGFGTGVAPHVSSVFKAYRNVQDKSASLDLAVEKQVLREDYIIDIRQKYYNLSLASFDKLKGKLLPKVLKSTLIGAGVGVVLGIALHLWRSR